MYNADQKIAGILNDARAGHTKAVQQRIDSVNEKKDIVDVTKGLYAAAKETVQAEKDAFELKQRTELAAEVKNVLDSWVRFEAQQREAEQNQLTESVIANVTAALKGDKAQKQIIDGAVAEIERAYNTLTRARQEQADLDAVVLTTVQRLVCVQVSCVGSLGRLSVPASCSRWRQRQRRAGALTQVAEWVPGQLRQRHPQPGAEGAQAV